MLLVGMWECCWSGCGSGRPRPTHCFVPTARVVSGHALDLLPRNHLLQALKELPAPDCEGSAV
jgi:hypothetical protein